MNTNISKTKYWHLNSVVREGRTWVNALICGILDLQGRNRSISANHNLTLKYKESQVQGCPDLTVYISKFCVPWIRYLKSLNVVWNWWMVGKGNWTICYLHLVKNPDSMKLIHLFPMHTVSTPWKHPKTVRVHWKQMG